MNRETTSSGAIIAVALVTLVLFGGSVLVLGVGAWFVFGARAAQEQALVEAEMARTQAIVAAESAADLAQQGTSRSTEINVSQVSIRLDQSGTIVVAGEPRQLSDLKSNLQRLADESDVNVTIHPDTHCEFQHIAAVLAVCKELGIENVRFETQE